MHAVTCRKCRKWPCARLTLLLAVWRKTRLAKNAAAYAAL
jgi:hypothetical protein